MYFGTFTWSMLSMFEMILGDWHEPCRVLVETMGEYYVLICLCHLMVCDFGVIAVINGVFINEIFQVTENDDNFMMMQQRHDLCPYRNRARSYFRRLRQKWRVGWRA